MSPRCELCKTTEGLSLCTSCEGYFCEAHWPEFSAHGEEKLRPGRVPHEKVDPKIAKQVDLCLNEPPDDEAERTQHLEDMHTRWFGFDRDSENRPILAEYRRYADIMMEHSEDTGDTRYPALVSFVGETGAGKSSLIRLLINPSGNDAPVIGRSTSHVPTSADVHLYADPKSYSTNRPILFADCEGFHGGEQDQVAALAVAAEARPSSTTARSRSHSHASLDARPNRFEEFVQGTRRVLQWARRSSIDYETTSKRGYAVERMYPRMLYAFSDVIVFVLTNARTLERVVEQMLDWAHANYTRTTNFPCKPHAIIALNQSDHSTPEHCWHPAAAKTHLLESANAQMHKNITFVKYTNQWKEAGIRIDNVEHLLQRYYSTVNVVRLPDKCRRDRMHKQGWELYNAIRNCCNDTKETKQARNMLPDTDEFGLYLSLAFDHFAESLEKPFDYVEASLKRRPPPITLEDNMNVFVRMVADTNRRSLDSDNQSEHAAKILFETMTPFIASCLMLDSSRKQHVGKADEWFARAHRDPRRYSWNGQRYQDRVPTQDPSYKKICGDVIKHYYDRHVPCEFKFRQPMSMPAVPCSQTRVNHGETHRARLMTGVTDFQGRFHSSFDLEKFDWESKVLEQLKELERSHSWHHSSNPRLTRSTAHRHSLRKFYGTIHKSIASFISHSICLSCLSNPPEHVLQCGHVLYTECAMDFGKVDGQSHVEVEGCPLHEDDITRFEGSTHLTRFILQPPFSGMRVLVLDGGGIRGIIEIRVMQAIEKRLGMRLSLFFDLAVGTSTGGIIALAFGDTMMTLDECASKFRSLSEQAFTPRTGQGLVGFRYLQLLIKKSRYKTEPFVKALKETFTEESILFGEVARPNKMKVAVTATSNSGSQTYVLSNYNTKNTRIRKDGQYLDTVKYIRYRPDAPEDEIKTWEAARSTAAAPGYFKPFSLPSPYKITPELIDGGVLHNNPVAIALEEAQRIAESSQQTRSPDVVLSIGTGKSENKPLQTQNTNWIQNMFTLISYQVALNINAEARWGDVFKKNRDLQSRMRRINPELGEELPLMDDVKEIDSLSSNVQCWLSGTDPSNEIDEIAHLLVASSFYFERSGHAERGGASSIDLSGNLKCRLSNDPEAIRLLGSFLAAAKHPTAFLVDNNPSSSKTQRIELKVTLMRDSGSWNDVPLRVRIPGEDAITTISIAMYEGRRFPISGFPRKFMRADFEARQK